jgi:hypothetical protein
MRPSYFSACVLIALASSCTDLGTDSPRSARFAIYRLLDTTVAASSIWESDIDALALGTLPFIDVDDLKAYYWSTHTFVPNPHIDSVLKSMQYHGGNLGGLPFVVVVGTERIYLGAIWWPHSSLMPQVPYFEILGEGSYTINPPPLSSDPDRRGDPRIREALRVAGVLTE